MNVLGRMIDDFSMPVCTAFEPSIFRGKQCYSLDVNMKLTSDEIFLKSGSINGLSFLVDNNLDRHFGQLESSNQEGIDHFRRFQNNREGRQEFEIFLNTLEPYEQEGGGDLAMTDVQKITGTEDYYQYAEGKGICQNDETLHSCGAKRFKEKLLKECGCIPFELLQLVEENGVTLCTPEQRVCYVAVIETQSFCMDLPKPCNGFYFDIRLTHYNGNSILTKSSLAAKTMIHEYEKYKGGMVTTYDGALTHVNQGINPGASASIKGCNLNQTS